MQPIDYVRPDHPELAIRAICLCLVPEEGIVAGHLGTAACCDDACDDCERSSCFVHWGCYAGDGTWADAPMTDEDDVDWGFSEPGGSSALRAATLGDHCIRHGCHGAVEPSDKWCRHCGQQLNPRTEPCPTCGTPNVLTPADVGHRYQCNRCAAATEQDRDITWGSYAP